MELAFRQLHPDAELPVRAHADDAGLDLRASEAARIGPGERVKVPTGLVVAIPEGHAGLVVPRSGLALHHGVTLANAPGLIDPGYRGEVGVVLLNADREAPFIVETGERIAQLLVVPFVLADPIWSQELGETERAEGGFGSTGR